MIPIIVVEKGDIINIERDLKIRILFPTNELIEENVLNNNSVVAKLEYKKFSMLFTGDIEKIAEEKLLKNISNNLLKTDILKVAHHGSKTSSIQEFVKKVQPKIALIGVGKNNKFKHPDYEVLNRLQQIGTIIYRTDVNGEISIKVDRKGRIDIKKFLDWLFNIISLFCIEITFRVNNKIKVNYILRKDVIWYEE